MKVEVGLSYSHTRVRNPFRGINPAVYAATALGSALLLGIAAIANHDALWNGLIDAMAVKQTEPVKLALDQGRALEVGQKYHEVMVIDAPITKAWNKGEVGVLKGVRGRLIGRVSDETEVRRVITIGTIAAARCGDFSGLVSKNPNNPPSDNEICQIDRSFIKAQPANASK